MSSQEIFPFGGKQMHRAFCGPGIRYISILPAAFRFALQEKRAPCTFFLSRRIIVA